jgi:excisionase family DNA binding protein
MLPTESNCEPKRLTAAQAAKKLRVSPARIRQLIRSKDLPATLFGNSYQILEPDLELVRKRPKAGRPPNSKNGTRSKIAKQRKSR